MCTYYYLISYIFMGSSFWFHTSNFGWSIVYVEGSLQLMTHEYYLDHLCLSKPGKQTLIEWLDHKPVH